MSLNHFLQTSRGVSNDLKIGCDDLVIRCTDNTELSYKLPSQGTAGESLTVDGSGSVVYGQSLNVQTLSLITTPVTPALVVPVNAGNTVLRRVGKFVELTGSLDFITGGGIAGPNLVCDIAYANTAVPGVSRYGIVSGVSSTGVGAVSGVAIIKDANTIELTVQFSSGAVNLPNSIIVWCLTYEEV